MATVNTGSTGTANSAHPTTQLLTPVTSSERRSLERLIKARIKSVHMELREMRGELWELIPAKVEARTAQLAVVPRAEAFAPAIRRLKHLYEQMVLVSAELASEIRAVGLAPKDSRWDDDEPSLLNGATLITEFQPCGLDGLVRREIMRLAPRHGESTVPASLKRKELDLLERTLLATRHTDLEKVVEDIPTVESLIDEAVERAVDSLLERLSPDFG